MRKLAALAVSTAAAATMFSTPAAQAVEVCDPIIPRGVCILVLDDAQNCGPGYDTVVRVPNLVTGGVVVAVCFLL